MTHFAGHQQALIKNNICVHVLSFADHDAIVMQETFANFDYDVVLDLCVVQKDATLGSSWDGENFNVHLYPSWTLGEDLKWHPPISKPEGQFWWNEELQNWVQQSGENIAPI